MPRVNNSGLLCRQAGAMETPEKRARGESDNMELAYSFFAYVRALFHAFSYKSFIGLLAALTKLLT